MMMLMMMMMMMMTCLASVLVPLGLAITAPVVRTGLVLEAGLWRVGCHKAMAAALFSGRSSGVVQARQGLQARVLAPQPFELLAPPTMICHCFYQEQRRWRWRMSSPVVNVRYAGSHRVSVRR
jgi:hypothetical protein